MIQPLRVSRRVPLLVQNFVAPPPRRKPPTGGGDNNNNPPPSNPGDMFGDEQRMLLNKLFYSKMSPSYLNLIVQRQFQRPTHMEIIEVKGFYMLRIQPIDEYIIEYEDDTAYDLICEKINFWGLSSYVADKIKGSALTWFTTTIDIPLGIPVDGNRVDEFLPPTGNKKFEDLEEI
jgi:hypothetical protein